jgi:short-subunit dehydrogenase
MNDSLKGKVVVVAGAGGGIGAAVSKRLAEEGADLSLVNRENDRFQSVLQYVRSLSPRAVGTPAELTTFGEWQRIIASTLHAFGRIDGLVNCLGANRAGHFCETTPVEIEAMVRANILSVAFGVRAVLPRMSAQHGGRIVVIGSMGGYFPVPHEALYSAMKFAVRGLCLSLYNELRPGGVTVTVISPGPVRTRMLDEEAKHETANLTFFSTPIPPEEVAGAVCRALLRPCREIVLPAVSGKLAMLGAAFPGLIGRITPWMETIGRYNRRRYARGMRSTDPAQGKRRRDIQPPKDDPGSDDSA